MITGDKMPRWDTERAWVKDSLAILNPEQVAVLAERLTGRRAERVVGHDALAKLVVEWAIDELNRGHGVAWMRRTVIAGVRNILTDHVGRLRAGIRMTEATIARLNAELAEE